VSRSSALLSPAIKLVREISLAMLSDKSNKYIIILNRLTHLKTKFNISMYLFDRSMFYLIYFEINVQFFFFFST